VKGVSKTSQHEKSEKKARSKESKGGKKQKKFGDGQKGRATVNREFRLSEKKGHEFSSSEGSVTKRDLDQRERKKQYQGG